MMLFELGTYKYILAIVCHENIDNFRVFLVEMCKD